MKLYEIPEGSKIKIDEGIITFHHIDGMYSYCTFDDGLTEDSVVHLSANLPLKKVGDYYEINDKT